MARLEIRPFSAEFVASAGDLLSDRHRTHRAAEPLLPEGYEDPAAAAAEVDALASSEGASGAVALRGRRVVGYILGTRKDDELWGPNVWVDSAGHAVADPEDPRDLGLARPGGAALLGWAATRPDVRGSGAGLTLTQASLAWAREQGYTTIVTDWRVTNLLSSRFWPKRGFRETFLRLYRHIP